MNSLDQQLPSFVVSDTKIQEATNAFDRTLINETRIQVKIEESEKGLGYGRYFLVGKGRDHGKSKIRHEATIHKIF